MSLSTTPIYLTTSATTNSTLIAGGDRTLYELTISNPTASAAFVKLFNKATAPTVGVDVPLVTIPVLAGSLVAVGFGAEGKDFTLGIGLAVTASGDAGDATATVAGIQISGTRS